MTLGSDDITSLKKETAYQGYFRIEEHRISHRLYQGGWSGELMREAFIRKPVVGVLLFDPHRDAVVLVEQFRIGPYADPHQHLDSPWITEVIAGVLGDGETYEGVATRESQEEAGLSICNLEKICDCYFSPGCSTEFLTLFVAQVDASQASDFCGLAHEGEDIRVQVVPTAEAFAALADNQYHSSSIIMALQWLQLHKAPLTARWTGA